MPSSKAWPGYSISIGIWQSSAGATTKTGSRDRSRPRQRKCLSLFNDLSTLLLKKREKRSRSIGTRGTPPCSLRLTLSSESQLAALVLEILWQPRPTSVALAYSPIRVIDSSARSARVGRIYCVGPRTAHAQLRSSGCTTSVHYILTTRQTRDIVYQCYASPCSTSRCSSWHMGRYRCKRARMVPLNIPRRFHQVYHQPCSDPTVTHSARYINCTS